MKPHKEEEALGIAQHRSSESPSISEDGLRGLVDLVHVVLELGRHHCVRLCMCLSHTAEIVADTLINSFSLSDQLTATPFRNKYLYGLRGIAWSPRAVGSSFNPADFIFTSIQNDTTSQSENNERGVVPSSALIKRKMRRSSPHNGYRKP